MDEWMYNPMNGVTVVLAIIVIIIGIRIMVVGSRLKKLRKQYVEVMGNTGVTDLESVIVDLKQTIAAQAEHTQHIQSQMEIMQRVQMQGKGRVGIIRYNAFADQGSDLSFSIAVVNGADDGMVISGIHSRENTYVYAKPLDKGESSYPLTPEERKAIEQAK
ncbi:DUF4446 family protein [Paenibacillus gorillae]|uniref:DUF4446 family protein n=1 Tax=Paenibacillus gorillae TaxID=1243662 RepID=UPI0004B55843|nr:DUF4446 family protein [Paenibacillus gorillae]